MLRRQLAFFKKLRYTFHRILQNSKQTFAHPKLPFPVKLCCRKIEPWPSHQPRGPRSSRSERRSSPGTRAIAMASSSAIGGSLRVSTTVSVGASRACTRCQISVTVRPRALSTCSPTVSGRSSFTTSR